MVTGRLRKYYKDSVLLEQECVIGEEGGSVAEVRGVVPPALPSLTVVLRMAHHPRAPPPLRHRAFCVAIEAGCHGSGRQVCGRLRLRPHQVRGDRDQQQ